MMPNADRRRCALAANDLQLQVVPRQAHGLLGTGPE
jgi:hypothetical protein